MMEITGWELIPPKVLVANNSHQECNGHQGTCWKHILEALCRGWGYYNIMLTCKVDPHFNKFPS